MDQPATVGGPRGPLASAPWLHCDEAGSQSGWGVRDALGVESGMWAQKNPAEAGFSRTEEWREGSASHARRVAHARDLVFPGSRAAPRLCALGSGRAAGDEQAGGEQQKAEEALGEQIHERLNKRITGKLAS